MTSDVVRSLVRGADATADTQHHVGLLADARVGGQQQVRQRFPGVVATSVAVLDLHDDGRVSVFQDARDGQYRCDLGCGSWLEGDVAETSALQLSDQFRCFIQFRDTGGDDHTIDRCTGLASLRDDALRTKVEVPQVAVHEHRVELGGTARFQLFAQLSQVLREDGLGDLSATSQLGPVAGVSCSGNDLWVDRGRGHACEHDWRIAGQTGEGSLHLRAGSGVNELGRPCRPVGGR